MILMDRIVGPDVPLEVFFSFFFRFHIVSEVQSFERVKLLLIHLAKASLEVFPSQ